MASRMAFLQLRRGSASLACSGGTMMAGPWMAVWRFALCKAKTTRVQQTNRCWTLLGGCWLTVGGVAVVRVDASPGPYPCGRSDARATTAPRSVGDRVAGPAGSTGHSHNVTDDFAFRLVVRRQHPGLTDLAAQ
jgi:hypothetical protein